MNEDYLDLICNGNEWFVATPFGYVPLRDMVIKDEKNKFKEINNYVRLYIQKYLYYERNN